MDNKDFQTTHRLHVTYDPAYNDLSGIAISEIEITEYFGKNFKVSNAALGDDADILLQILMDPETTERAIDYIRRCSDEKA